MGLEDLWDEPAPKRTRRAKVKDPLRGFQAHLGTVKKRGMNKETGKIELKEVDVYLAKDPLCWVLRIGSETTFPVSLSSVFETLAQREPLITSDRDIESLINEAKRIENKIREMGLLLDKKIGAYLKKKLKNGR